MSLDIFPQQTSYKSEETHLKQGRTCFCSCHPVSWPAATGIVSPMVQTIDLPRTAQHRQAASGTSQLACGGRHLLASSSPEA